MKKNSRVVIVEVGKLLMFFRRKIRNRTEVTYYAVSGETCENDMGVLDLIKKVKVLNYEN